MILNGKTLAEKIQSDLKQKIETLKGRPPCLGVILVGDHKPSMIYVKRKTEALLQVGMTFLRKSFDESISEKDLLKEIELFNQNKEVDGILVQLPLPAHIDTKKVILAIDPNKDVDGFHPTNLGKLLIGDDSGFIPCTPLGIRTLLLDAGVSVAKKNALVIGRSTIVGKPMAALLMQNAPFGNATVTIANSQTKDLAKIAREADLLIAAIGKPHFVTKEFIKPKAIVIDVGINRLEDKLVGDVFFEEVSQKASLITPVPGGVGPMTIASLLQNTFKSYLRTLSLFLILFLTSCEKEELLSISGNAMTIDYKVLVTAKEKERHLIEQVIFETFFEIDSLYNKWNPNSQLSLFNQNKEGDFRKIEPFLKQVNDYVLLTGSAFDPTVETLQKVWKNGAIPEEKLLEEAKEATGWRHLIFENGTLRKDHPLTEIDLGGVAKGFAVDQIAESLIKKGFSNGLVEWGGELRAFGTHPEKRPWIVSIKAFEEIIETLYLKESSLATSGDYEQNWSVGDKRFTHVFSPQKGEPLKIEKGSIGSVSVKAKTCALADALATAAMVQETEERAVLFLEEIKRHIPEIEYWIVIRSQ